MGLKELTLGLKELTLGLKELTERLKELTEVLKELTEWLKELTEGFCLKVYEDGASEGIRNDKGWRSQVVGSGQRVDTTLKVAIPRQHPDSYDITLKQTHNMASQTRSSCLKH